VELLLLVPAPGLLRLLLLLLLLHLLLLLLLWFLVTKESTCMQVMVLALSDTAYSCAEHALPCRCCC
jgi:hypothetical protein